MSWKGFRAFLFVSVVCGTILALLFSVVFLVGIGTHPVTSVGVRWIILVLMLAAEGGAILWLVRWMNIREPEGYRWLSHGLLVGSVTMAIALSPALLEKLNATLDSSSRRIVVRIESCSSIAGFRALSVTDWSDPTKTRTVFWSYRVNSPADAVKIGDCLSAKIGDGFFGLSWMTDGVIGECSPGSATQAP